MHVIRVRNVNEAMVKFRSLFNEHQKHWRTNYPRGIKAVEFNTAVCTTYAHPRERVLFSAARDANPFFHFVEALWIIAGRNDVETLKYYNANMANYSDDGRIFHAPYGDRLRYHFGVDQIAGCIEALRREPDTRQAVMAIWSPSVDLNVKSRDIPCNDLVMFKLRDGKLDMTVCCRSNDIIWGAYGANVVQFSTLQEYVACALACAVGTYHQVSDSYHVYPETEVFMRVMADDTLPHDPYTSSDMPITAYPLFVNSDNLEGWNVDLHEFLDGGRVRFREPFFENVAVPIAVAWDYHKSRDYETALRAIDRCHAGDWKLACTEWLKRRQQGWEEGSRQ